MSTKEETITTSKTVSHTYCDRCDKEIRTDGSKRKCSICGRDVCYECGVFYDEDLFSTEYYDEYPLIACKICWDIGEPFIKEIKDIRSKSGHQIRDVKYRWEMVAKGDYNDFSTE